MEFKPLTDDEIKTLRLPPEGRYKFTVLRTTQKRSKNGQDYFNLKMRIKGENGKEYTVFDMLFFEGVMMFKTKHFCEGTGLEKQYLAGKLPVVDCDGREGFLDLAHRLDKNSGEMVSSVKDYVVPVREETQEFNDELPF